MMSIYTRQLIFCGFAAMVALATAQAQADDVPAKPDTLIIRTWPGPWNNAMETIGKAFTEKTGIQVKIDNRPDEAVVKLIQVARSQKREPPVDIVYTMETNSYKATAQGLTEPLTTADVPNLANMTAAAMPASGTWNYVKIGTDVEPLIYRVSAFPNGAPDSLSVLFDPKFKGRIYANGSSIPAIATTAMLNQWSVPKDMDKIWSFIEDKLKPQHPILGFDQEFIAGFQRNEVDLGISFPSNARELHDPNIKIAVAKEGLYGADEAFFVASGLPESRNYWAKQFINLILSTNTLAKYCETLTLPCYGKGLPVPASAAEDASFPKTEADFDRIYRMPVNVIAEQNATWDAKFSAMMN